MKQIIDVRNFVTSVEGRLKKYKVKSSLDPIFEAFTNAIHAIEERFENNVHKGSIKITLKRSSPQLAVFLEGAPDPIFESIIIEDDGIGFNEQNFKSFLTIDSLYKTEKGGQGIGRLAWLKVFEEVSIESGYQSTDDEKRPYYIRPFSFQAKGVSEYQILDNPESNVFTRLSLLRLKEDYRNNFPKDIGKVALKIIQHFLTYFATGYIPRIELVDEYKHEHIIVNDLYNDLFGKNQIVAEVIIDDHKFKTTTLIGSNLNFKSNISLFAHKRCVSDEALETYYPLAKHALYNEDGAEIKALTIVESEYLDTNVNDSRTEFVLPKKEDEQGNLISPTTIDTIYFEIARMLAEKLKAYFDKAEKENSAHITSYINEKSPRYRTLLKYKKKEVESLIYVADKDIDLKLRKIEFDLELESLSAANLITDKITKTEDIHNLSNELFEKVTDIGKANLAQYICNRRAVLSIFQKALELQEDSKFVKEEVIHRLIYPLGKTSDELPYEQQNLWIIDERLAFHNYLASDVALKKMAVLENDSGLEPDIAIFKGPMALTDETAPFNTVVIIEFKRPQRKDYSIDDNPIDQVVGYISKIRSKQAKDRTGRIVDIDPSATRFFCHIICDLNSNLEEIIERNNYKRTPDRGGFFYFHEKYNAYIEISSYDKILNDAMKRNKILFEKLKI